jgi:hypothetical protein
MQQFAMAKQLRFLPLPLVVHMNGMMPQQVATYWPPMPTIQPHP